MAVNETKSHKGTAVSTGKKVVVGTNVFVSIVALGAIVLLVQWLVAAYANPRFDMTSSGLNKLSTSTEKLVTSLTIPVTITSLYYQTDMESEDQPKYRRAVDQLLAVFETANRSKVITRRVNPIKDHEAYAAIRKRLRKHPKFQDQLDQYEERITAFRVDIAPGINALIEHELGLLRNFAGGLADARDSESIFSQMDVAFKDLQSKIQTIVNNVQDFMSLENPAYETVKVDIERTYDQLVLALRSIAEFAEQTVLKTPELTTEESDFLSGAAKRYQDLITQMETEHDVLAEMSRLELEDMFARISRESNAVLVESELDVQVINFRDMWPPAGEDVSSDTSFKNRTFRGEELIVASILRVTQASQPAVVFARFGGPPLFQSYTPAGMQRMEAPYRKLKDKLEFANFRVIEWDLKETDFAPVIDPPPTRTLYVVMKPFPKRQNPFQKEDPFDQPFGDIDREALLKAMGPSPRAIFLTGYYMAGPMEFRVPTYEYNDYLRETWGIEIDPTRLLIKAVEVTPGNFTLQTAIITDVTLGDSPIVNNKDANVVGLPFVAPIRIADPKPDDVNHTTLLTIPNRVDLWGLTQDSLTKYVRLQQEKEIISMRMEDDESGPWTVAIAAENQAGGKIVLVSSRDYATDAIAMMPKGYILANEGLVPLLAYPGNTNLMINSLHWLNESEDLMNVGRAVEAFTLDIRDRATQRTVQFITIVVWPSVALFLGGIMWWLRRA